MENYSIWNIFQDFQIIHVFCYLKDVREVFMLENFIKPEKTWYLIRPSQMVKLLPDLRSLQHKKYLSYLLQVSSHITHWETLLHNLKNWWKVAKTGVSLSKAIKYNAFPICTTFPYSFFIIFGWMKKLLIDFFFKI